VQEVSAHGITVEVEQPDMYCSDLHGIEDEDILTVQRRHILDIDSPREGE
jgi:hypothetical protein